MTHPDTDQQVRKFRRKLLIQEFIDTVNASKLFYPKGEAKTLEEAAYKAMGVLSMAETVFWFDKLGIEWEVSKEQWGAR
jgi:hypothetical protein